MRTVVSYAMTFILFFYLPGLASAAPVSFSSMETNTRLDTVSQLLSNQETGANEWEYGGGAFDTGTLVWSAAQASNETDHKARATDIVNAGESLIGLADVIFRPLPAFDAGSACPEYAETEEDKIKCLTKKERLLELSAERAREPYELLPHLGNAGFNLLAGLIVLRVGGTGRALATAIPGEIIGEMQIWTTPSQPIADYNQYNIRFSPLLAETGHAQSPAGGLIVSFAF